MTNKSVTALTLTELMVVLAIFTVITGAIFLTLAAGKTSWYSGNAQIDVQQEARRGIDRMVKELRQSASTTIIGVPANGISYNTITFRMSQGWDNVTNTIIWGNQVQYSVGGLNNQQLLRTQAGQTDVLANNVANIQFRRQALTPNIVEISLQVLKTNLQGRNIGITLNSQAMLRN